MRPLITIGASPEMRTALEPYAQVGHIEHHPTAEAAHWSLLDSGASADTLEGRGWHAHVAYGPHAYGPLLTPGVAATTRLQHTGRTLVLCWGADHDPARPRRVVDGRITDEPANTMVWQVAAVIGADYVVDLAHPDWVQFVVRLLEWKDGAHT